MNVTLAARPAGKAPPTSVKLLLHENRVFTQPWETMNGLRSTAGEAGAAQTRRQSVLMETR